MNRRLQTSLPITPSQLQPTVPDMSLVRERETRARQKQKDNFDQRHRAASLAPLSPGDDVWITDQETYGTVVEQTAPRSYQVATQSGEVRRNRLHLNPQIRLLNSHLA